MGVINCFCLPFTGVYGAQVFQGTKSFQFSHWKVLSSLLCMSKSSKEAFINFRVSFHFGRHLEIFPCSRPFDTLHLYMMHSSQSYFFGDHKTIFFWAHFIAKMAVFSAPPSSVIRVTFPLPLPNPIREERQPGRAGSFLPYSLYLFPRLPKNIQTCTLLALIY